MQQLANRDPYYNILAPQVAGNLTTAEYDGLFHAYKVIYPDYAARHYVGEIQTMGGGPHGATLVHLPQHHGLLSLGGYRPGQPNAGSTSTFDFGHPQLALSRLEN